METEARSCPSIVANHLQAQSADMGELARYIRSMDPQSITTIARGSSDHAASYLAYLAMSKTGRLVTSLPPSLISLENAPIRATRMLSIAISQSGRSPDIIAPMEYFRTHGATTVALVNDVHSPLAHAAQYAYDLRAGPEKGLAATKSFINSLLLAYLLVARWTDDKKALDAAFSLPDLLHKALEQDWSAGVQALAGAQRCMAAGRGLGYPVAMELALKLKETAAIQAEPFSGAEIKHGPMALIEQEYPLIVFAMPGSAFATQLHLAKDMQQRGARVLLCAPIGTPGVNLPMVCSENHALNCLLAVLSAYIFAAQLCAVRGVDPDAPRHLNKITLTV
jgi:glucosamine--fructose-6-phosphate aminotransferase (isomerizing)